MVIQKEGPGQKELHPGAGAGTHNELGRSGEEPRTQRIGSGWTPTISELNIPSYAERVETGRWVL